MLWMKGLEHLKSEVELSPFVRRLFGTCGVFTRYFFVAFSWFFRGFFVTLFCLEKQCSGLFRYFFVAFSWLFRGPRFGQILRVLALEQSSDFGAPPEELYEKGSSVSWVTKVKGDENSECKLSSASPRPQPSKPHPCNMPQALRPRRPARKSYFGPPAQNRKRNRSPPENRKKAVQK